MAKAACIFFHVIRTDVYEDVQGCVTSSVVSYLIFQGYIACQAHVYERNGRLHFSVFYVTDVTYCLMRGTGLSPRNSYFSDVTLSSYVCITVRGTGMVITGSFSMAHILCMVRPRVYSLREIVRVSNYEISISIEI